MHTTIFFLSPHFSFRCIALVFFGLYMFDQRFVWKSSVIGINRISKSWQNKRNYSDEQKYLPLSELFHIGNICGFDHVWYFTCSIDLAWEERPLPSVAHLLVQPKISCSVEVIADWMGIAGLLILTLYIDLCQCGSKLSYCLFVLFL